MDSVLLWPTYPNLGLDDRNQFDLLRLANLSGAIGDFQRRGVLLPYNPWDVATRREGRRAAEALAALGAALGAGSFSGDTMKRVPREFWEARARGPADGHRARGGGYPTPLRCRPRRLRRDAGARWLGLRVGGHREGGQ